MTIIRDGQRERFAIISQAVFNDHRLSPVALGILCYLLSRPDNWQTSPGQLRERFGLSKYAMRAVMRELTEAGYCRRTHRQDHRGKMVGWVYDVMESPCCPDAYRVDDKPGLGATESRVHRRSDKPSLGIVKTPTDKDSNQTSRVDEIPKVDSTDNRHYRTSAQQTLINTEYITTTPSKDLPAVTKQAGRKHRLSEAFVVTDKMRRWYDEQSGFVLPLDQATEQWQDAMVAGGYTYVDWQRAWKNGMRKQNTWERERLARQQGLQQGAHHGRQARKALTSGELFANLTAECIGKPKPFGSDS